jgi:glycerol kinase
MQFQADVLGLEIVRPEVIETTAVGAAFLAGLATGVWQSSSAITDAWAPDRRFHPAMAAEERAEHLGRWARAVKIA